MKYIIVYYSLQRVQRGGLAAEGHAHEHHAVPHGVALVELDNLLDEVRVRLAVDLLEVEVQLVLYI